MSSTACDDQFNDPPIETSEGEARPYQPTQPCCADPRPDCMGMLVEGIGKRCRAMGQPPSGQSDAPADNGEPPFLQRLRAEFSDLAERQAKLTAFIGTPGFRMLDDADANLLARQARLHQSLLEVLEERIQLASAKHGAPKTTGGDNGE